ncbi:hypothetical protein C484_02554 [Natrialba taiwanensis DSM 12281]|uniref:Uncharacterized protein n=1 Tax=Natrialba taiwanensis DSM 12281 TaxID=1230458 RepID=M0AER6_9EURY|nr:hypothetical protein C484_02554 [Natrialba taiwanensis DSM 12281]
MAVVRVMRMALLVQIVLVVVAVMVGVAIISVIAVRMSVRVFTNPKHDEQDTGNKTDWPADLDTTKYRHWLVYLREVEVVLRVEEYSHHRDTADKVADADNEARREPVHPLVRLVKSVRGGNGPSVTWFDAMNSTESDRSKEETECVAV